MLKSMMVHISAMPFGVGFLSSEFNHVAANSRTGGWFVGTGWAGAVCGG
jgi:hypothetical protein